MNNSIFSVLISIVQRITGRWIIMHDIIKYVRQLFSNFCHIAFTQHFNLPNQQPNYSGM